MSLNFVFIGAGNLATHLSEILQKKGNNVLQVYSRTDESARILGEKLQAGYTSDPGKIVQNADVYLIALKDSAFHEVLPLMDFKNKLVVHSSGSLPRSVLDEYSLNNGVFYPLQTFSKNRSVDFQKIPLFIEANSKENKNTLLRLAKSVSDSVVVIDSEKRRFIHIAAVFACNFVNHFYTISGELLKNKEISFDILKPLILETALKVQNMDPEEAQTGPAVRFDETIISTHLKELDEFPDYKELYNSISKSIFEFHQKKQ